LDEVDKSQKDGQQVASVAAEVTSLRQRFERLQEENSYLRDKQRRFEVDTSTASEAQLKKHLQEARDDLVN
jgi:hypothetical protein